MALIAGVYWSVSFLINQDSEVIQSSQPSASPEESVFSNEDNTVYQAPPKVIFSFSWDDAAFSLQSENWYQNLGSGGYHQVSGIESSQEADNTILTSDETISFSYDTEPDSIIYEVFDQNTDTLVLSEETTDSTIPVMSEQGDYLYVITFLWNDDHRLYTGEYRYTLPLFVDLPAYFEFSKLSVKQGDFIKITAYNVNDDQVPVVNQSVFNRFKLFKSGYTYEGFLPAGYYTGKGTYELEYGFLGEPLLKESLTVLPYDFKIQYLWINETLAAATKNDESSAEYNKYFSPTRWQSNEQAYYTESFVLPATGHLSTEFGENRYTNGLPTSYHHSGLDIGNEIDSPIYATNRGKVVLSMYLIMTGNTIVIDHGQGLFSVYFHMNSTIAKEGDMVERGEQIGYMGTTGFSTGSHLHFTMSFFDTNIDPGYLLVGEPITKENAEEYLN